MAEMDIGLLYALVAYISCAVIALVLNRTLATKYKEVVDKPFAMMLVFFIAFCFIDGSWGLFFSEKIFAGLPFYAFGYEFFTYAFHAMAALSAFFWSGYMAKYIHLGQRARRQLFGVRLLLLAAQWGILVVNIWRHNAFSFVDAQYVPGPWRKALFWLQFSYYIIVAGAIFLLRFGKKYRRKKTYRTALLFSSMPLLAGLLQLLCPDAPMYSLGFLVSAVVIYAFNITASREEYLAKALWDENSKLSSVISGLSDDFLYIYCVDMDTHEYDSYGGDAHLTLQPRRKRAGEAHRHFFADHEDDLERTIHPEDYDFVKTMLSEDHIREELATRKSYSFNYRTNDNGHIRCNMIKVIRADVATGGNKVIIGVFDDDERVRKEIAQQAQLQFARRQAEQASQAKTNFLFNMSHDIRTPMNAILGFTDMAEKHIDDRDKAKECLGKVRNAGQFLLSLINDLLDMSRIESGKIRLENRPMSLKEIGDSIFDIVGGMAKERQIHLVNDSTVSEHRFVYGDEMHYNRICMNLLTNSIKYTNPGGTVTYSITEKPCDKPGYAMFDLVVQDTGIGMSPEYVKHIFEMFSRERSSTVSGVQGTGLGMAITKSLVDLMGGTIDIQSEQGVGTTVTISIRFKLAEESEFAGDATHTEVNDQRLVGLRVLVVEDNALNREIAVDMLSEYGMVVFEADDGQVAVEKCRKLANGESDEMYDVILMDIQMPVMDGYTASQTIRGMDSDYCRTVPIVALTANVFAEDIQKSKEAGMTAHLGKPIQIKELLRVLAEQVPEM